MLYSPSSPKRLLAAAMAALLASILACSACSSPAAPASGLLLLLDLRLLLRHLLLLRLLLLLHRSYARLNVGAVLRSEPLNLTLSATNWFWAL